MRSKFPSCLIPQSLSSTAQILVYSVFPKMSYMDRYTCFLYIKVFHVNILSCVLLFVCFPLNKPTSFILLEEVDEEKTQNRKVQSNSLVTRGKAGREERVRLWT